MSLILKSGRMTPHIRVLSGKFPNISGKKFPFLPWSYSALSPSKYSPLQSPAHGFFPECYFQHFKCLSNRFSSFHTEFHRNSLLMKNTHFSSRENHQMRQTCDHIKKHSTMTKQDRAMLFSRRSSSNSLLESSTCRAPLGRRNSGLFWMFGNFPDSPCMYTARWPT
jgi:hypothetical protein